VKRLWRATINSWNGLVAAARSEEAFRQELVLAAIAIPLAFWLTNDFARRFALVGTIVIIMIAELLNTAIEKLSDRVTMENDQAIGRVKDMGSSAVGLSLLLAAGVWLWVIAERFVF
jgi:diacylglycerol kinase (ATP)